MSNTRQELINMDFQEYLKFEKKSVEQHEYFFGEIIKRDPSTLKHNQIMGAMALAIGQELDREKFLTLFCEIKLELQKDNLCVYPDVMVTCDVYDLSDRSKEIIHHPSIIVEVLSDSTELYDRNIKKHYYLKLPSLKYYLLVSQNETKVEMFEKIEKRIEYSFYENPDENIEFQQLGFTIKVADIFGLPF